MTTSESNSQFFFYKTNRFESIRTTNRIDSNRELECTNAYAATTHALNHVTRTQGVKNNYIFGIPDPDLPIHYATFIALYTTTNKGRLLSSRSMLKPFSGEKNYKSGRNGAQNDVFYSKLGSKPQVLFSRPPKGTTAEPRRLSFALKSVGASRLQPFSRTKTRSSAIAEATRDASCQLKSCQLPLNGAETTYTTSPDQIDGMKLEIQSEAMSDRQCALNHDAIESALIVSSVINKPTTLSCVCHLSTDDLLWRTFLSL